LARKATGIGTIEVWITFPFAIIYIKGKSCSYKTSIFWKVGAGLTNSIHVESAVSSV
jgi:hypothetical protein